MAKPFDEPRFIQALTRHQPALEAYCHATLANREDARDVLQATSLKLWEKAAEWDPTTEFLPWAFAVARFTALSLVRDRMRDRLVFDEDVVLAMAQDCETAAGRFDARREALGICMDKLDSDNRSLLRAHYVDARSLREIAAADRRTLSAVKMAIARLRRQLGQCIERQLRAYA